MKLPIPEPLESRARRLLLIVCALFLPVMGGFAGLWYLERTDWLGYIDIPLHLIGA